MPNAIYNYKSAFYSFTAPDVIRSAHEIVKIAKDVLNPRSIVDVGCGTGTWLKVWSDFGVGDILGIDGDWIRPNHLVIPLDRFRSMDLSAPTALVREYDLVQSLEVAEHLPKAAAEAFVSFLCSLGPVVLFSAAIPYQGGRGHINEQWPEYWAELFMRKGYVAIDTIRNRVWDNPNVEWWYSQNILIFAQAEHLKSLEGLSELYVVQPQGSLTKVHPRLWLERNGRPLPLEKIVKMLPGSGFQFFQRAFLKLSNMFN